MSYSIQLFKHGGPKTFRYIETPRPEMRPDGIRIQVAACGVNFADVMMRVGLYPEAPKLPFTPGYEVSGTVVEVGDQVTAFKPGDRVLGGCHFGGYTTEIVLPEFQVRKTPAYLSDIEAAAIPVNFLTAWIALQEMARIRKGDRVLVQSAAGGVGTAAVQIATNAGAEVIGLIGSPSKDAYVRELGAARTILNSDWESMNDFEAGGFQVILDCEGGKSLKRNYRRLSSGGRVITYGLANAVTGSHRSPIKILGQLMNTPFFHTFKLMMDNKGVFGVNLLQLFEPSQGGMMRRVFDEVMTEFEARRLQPRIGKTFSLEEAGAAHLHLQSRSNVGKVVLVVRT